MLFFFSLERYLLFKNYKNICGLFFKVMVILMSKLLFFFHLRPVKGGRARRKQVQSQDDESDSENEND